jgi:hypothetical protein
VSGRRSILINCVDGGTVGWFFVLVGACGGDGWGDREGTAAASEQPADAIMVKGSSEVAVRGEMMMMRASC